MKTINNEIQGRVEKIFTKLRESCDATKFCDTFMKTYAEEQQQLKFIYDSSPASLAALEEVIITAYLFYILKVFWISCNTHNNL